MPNNKKLKARMVEKGYTIQLLAKEMGITPYTLGQKLAGKKTLSIKEAQFLQEKLSIPDEEIATYFFKQEVA